MRELNANKQQQTGESVGKRERAVTFEKFVEEVKKRGESQ